MNAKKRKKQIYSRLTTYQGRVMVKSYDGKWMTYTRWSGRPRLYWPTP